MSLKRHAARRDANEPAIVQALKAVGATVTQVSGRGAPDLFVRFRGRDYGLEIKGAKGKPTAAQRITRWPIVRTVNDALRAIGAQTRG